LCTYSTQDAHYGCTRSQAGRRKRVPAKENFRERACERLSFNSPMAEGVASCLQKTRRISGAFPEAEYARKWGTGSLRKRTWEDRDCFITNSLETLLESSIYSNHQTVSSWPRFSQARNIILTSQEYHIDKHYMSEQTHTCLRSSLAL